MPTHRSEQHEHTTQPVVRTVLGDIPAETLGICDAHEHVIIRGEFIAELFPEFLLDDADAACVDLREFHAAGGSWIVDTMPTGAGRDALMLRGVARQTRVPIVCPTGVHLPIYYPPDHPILKMDRGALTELFIREITAGIDDGNGIADILAGVIKVAGGENHLTAFQKETFIAAAQAQSRTGCPIITHCENGTAGLEQAALLERHGADLAHVVLSHCDKVNDLSYHRDLLSTGVRLEYDQHFRQIARGETCATAKLIVELAPLFPNQIMVGMDIARRNNWRGYGGRPGLAWLVTHLPTLLTDAGLNDALLQNILVRNAQTAFAMCPKWVQHP
ncbi:MAG: hypothetical protein R3C45_06705 [Phycisphaerales bacterium]